MLATSTSRLRVSMVTSPSWEQPQIRPNLKRGERLRFISFVSASIRGDLLWMEVDLTAATDVRFTNARIDSVVDEPKSWPKLGRLDLRGMTYTMLQDMAAVAR